jgi:hypothetical protein
LPAEHDDSAGGLERIRDHEPPSSASDAERQQKQHSGERVIIVSSKFHTRRVKVLWRILVGAHLEAIVRYTPDDPFEPDRWWHTTTDAMTVAREWSGLLNAWAGFPLKSTR